MTHRRVHGAAAIVAVAPGERTRLVERRQHVHAPARVGAELVPLVACAARRRAGRGSPRCPVLDLDRPGRHARVVALEAGADEPLVPGPASARVGRRVDADEAAAAVDVALERPLLARAGDRRAGGGEEDDRLVAAESARGERARRRRSASTAKPCRRPSRSIARTPSGIESWRKPVVLVNTSTWKRSRAWAARSGSASPPQAARPRSPRSVRQVSVRIEAGAPPSRRPECASVYGRPQPAPLNSTQLIRPMLPVGGVVFGAVTERNTR